MLDPRCLVDHTISKAFQYRDGAPWGLIDYVLV